MEKKILTERKTLGNIIIRTSSITYSIIMLDIKAAHKPYNE